jgi:hypothetical protein
MVTEHARERQRGKHAQCSDSPLEKRLTAVNFGKNGHPCFPEGCSTASFHRRRRRSRSTEPPHIGGRVDAEAGGLKDL